jgi:hypothetical protein
MVLANRWQIYLKAMLRIRLRKGLSNFAGSGSATFVVNKDPYLLPRAIWIYILKFFTNTGTTSDGVRHYDANINTSDVSVRSLILWKSNHSVGSGSGSTSHWKVGSGSEKLLDPQHGLNAAMCLASTSPCALYKIVEKSDEKRTHRFQEQYI